MCHASALLVPVLVLVLVPVLVLVLVLVPVLVLVLPHSRAESLLRVAPV